MVIFVMKKLINKLRIKKYCKVRDYCHYTGEHRCATYSNLKYSLPK